jgi:hypothetical protein
LPRISKKRGGKIPNSHEILRKLVVIRDDFSEVSNALQTMRKAMKRKDIRRISLFYLTPFDSR